MTRFITRIELHNADSDDYETLHKEMAIEGFEKTIKSYKGEEFHLLDAEYYYTKPVEIKINEHDYETVLKKAMKAANKTNKSFRAITSRTDGSHWHNLKLVE